MDALTALANGLNLRARLFYAGGVCGQWLMNHNSDKTIWFHLVSKGSGWVHSPAWQAPLQLMDGDLVLFLPHAARHLLSYSRDHLPSDPAGMRFTGWDDAETGFVCGEIELGMPSSPFWRAMPAELVIRKADAGDALARLIGVIIEEAADQRFGSESVIERLFDSIFVLVIRHCIEKNLVRKGVLAAMQDRRLATALGLIHGEPWAAWTLAELCSRSGLSKSVLAEKFSELIGVPPMEYLTTWRMQIAARWLKESGMTIERVAERCGYDSVPAFSKAFKRSFAVTPGAYRRGLVPSRA